MTEFVNISAYKFVRLAAERLPELREAMKAQADACQLKGTILLSPEGINCFLSGTRDAMETYKAFLGAWPEFADLWYKESFSDHQPFTRMLVRLKKEIIAFGLDDVKPDEQTAPYVTPETLAQWYDAGKDMIVLDTRNDYEIELGTFENAVDLNIEHFRHFPDAVDMLPASAREKPVVTFCTGGIRCEKAAELMRRKGFKEVYQLQGGILNYFEKVGGAHYEGECFVFDKRVALDPALKETPTKQCYGCRAAIPVHAQTKDVVCPECGRQGAIG